MHTQKLSRELMEAGRWMMTGDQDTDERTLVEQCLSGSKKAWDEFYARYFGLIRKVAARHHRVQASDRQDVVQSVLLTLCTALRKYDSQYPLSRFVCIVTERVCIDEYRRFKTAKRNGETVSVDHHDGSQDGSVQLPSKHDPHEEQLEREELLQFLRGALKSLGEKCRQLIQLRYYEELSFKEISKLLGAKENTLAVQSRRCLDELKARYLELEQEGSVT
jgi:RNA polymerase sigma factor (sigma-70 family)